MHVLGLARTGLIFTGLQEGAQPGGLTPPGQTEPGIPYHVPPCWVPVEGDRAAGTHSRLGSVRHRSYSGERFCGVVRFVLCIPLICIVVVAVPFVCCSVKLPLSQPTGFLPVSFHSPPHRGGGRVGRVALLMPAAAETKTSNWRPTWGRDNGRAEQRVLKLLS